MPSVVIDIDASSSPPPPPRAVAPTPAAPPEPVAPAKRQTIDLTSGDDDALPDALDFTQSQPKTAAGPSAKRSKLIDLMDDVSRTFYEPSQSVEPVKTKDKGKGKARARDTDDSEDDVSDSSTQRVPQPKKKRGRLTEEEKERREAEKLAAKKAKEAEREQKKVQATIDKAAKKAHNDANTNKTNRVDAVKEMHLECARSLATLPAFAPIYETVRRQLLELGILKIHQYDSPDDLLLVRWRRRVTNEWDESARVFRPFPDGHPRTVVEATVLLYLHVKELLTVQNLLDRVAAVRATNGSAVQVFILVDGLSTYQKAEKKRENDALKARLNGDGGNARGKKKAPDLTMDDIETALVRLQMTEKCHILRPKDATESIRWLVELTKDIGARRYRSVQHENAHNERLGIDGRTQALTIERNDLREGYIAMLTAIFRVSEGYAHQIAKTYPTLRCLYEAFETDPRGELLLVGTQKKRNADSQRSNIQMGKDGSRRIYTQLLVDEPGRAMGSMTGSKGSKKQQTAVPAGGNGSDDE